MLISTLIPTLDRRERQIQREVPYQCTKRVKFQGRVTLTLPKQSGSLQRVSATLVKYLNLLTMVLHQMIAFKATLETVGLSVHYPCLLIETSSLLEVDEVWNSIKI